MNCSECDCLIGYVNGKEITHTNINVRLLEFSKSLKQFTICRKPIHHPGFIHTFAFCPDCGEEIYWGDARVNKIKKIAQFKAKRCRIRNCTDCKLSFL